MCRQQLNKGLSPPSPTVGASLLTSRTSKARQPQKRSRKVAAATSSTAEAAPSSSWFIQPLERFATAESPSKAAEHLESTFWHHPILEVPATRDEAVVMLERLHQETAVQGTAAGANVVAFTGGNGPALTAYLLNNLFDGSVVGCIGDTTRLPREQVEHASFVADLLGIELLEVDERTWSKFEIPQALDTDAEELCNTLGQTTCEEADMVMFSGVTADNLAPFTRHGGVMQGIRAPLGGLSHAAVNALSKVVGLPDYFVVDTNAEEVAI